MSKAEATAHPNIAFIKYWGNRDHNLRIPSTGSISMNLRALQTNTIVEFISNLERDSLKINEIPQFGEPLRRVVSFMDRIRKIAGINLYAEIVSHNNFPSGTGLASSASGFAALSLAASKAAGLDLTERELSRLARSGSGSASRSIPTGFVQWMAGNDDLTSYAHSIAPPTYWDLVDCIAIISQNHKIIGSQEGHSRANTSPLQKFRVESAQERLNVCRQAILNRDFEAFAEVVELDSNLMHAVIFTSKPPTFYWMPATLDVMHNVMDMRQRGIPVCYTIDAGPNIHVICLKESSTTVAQEITQIPDVNQVIVSPPGGPASLSMHV